MTFKGTSKVQGKPLSTLFSSSKCMVYIFRLWHLVSLAFMTYFEDTEPTEYLIP